MDVTVVKTIDEDDEKVDGGAHAATVRPGRKCLNGLAVKRGDMG